ncbi:hypothetical protein [Nesterenkonia muleiensis]|uniref:hypothetical protein n=1 Tax=Nesterenkonia muleiensis TaxID=2282648 RepID=UPI001300A3F7|nr:hypothetical protein [Nesterenkonia muleiensis]
MLNVQRCDRSELKGSTVEAASSGFEVRATVVTFLSLNEQVKVLNALPTRKVGRHRNHNFNTDQGAECRQRSQ